ncbi:hypothetical protein BDF20DRAFT_911160 [Mycotypha africana]|uniref:uncharacterized protein n=1 Tax=Mycotypha africana TaxID=64632 RepID=UPI0022FFD911|nr:uncharacterized protein BDF20DRAFT_911160 [Mycotypha africana]KAI8983983.1 hypothetical protein BDF20DRAFT_911160 [Mycotypha africana]
MGLALEKCCCFIPLRIGTFIIALWFFIVYLIDAITGFLGVNCKNKQQPLKRIAINTYCKTAVIVYSGQTAKAWYYINLLFTVLLFVGGFAGIIGSLIAQRKSAKFFSVVVWISCAVSFIKYLISLVLMIVYRQNMINTCIRSGLVGIGNAQSGLLPTTISLNGYYTPVKYPNTLNAHATSMENCEQSVKTLIILWGVIVFVVQIVQVYFASVVGVYAARLRSGARHHRLHDQQIKDFEESRYHMSTVY